METSAVDTTPLISHHSMNHGIHLHHNSSIYNIAGTLVNQHHFRAYIASIFRVKEKNFNKNQQVSRWQAE
jgi:hypothetical protein